MPLKNKIENNFSKAASRYKQDALIQKEVALNVASLANDHITDNDLVLDLGCGTGFLGDEILKRKKVDFYASDISLQMLEQVSKNQKHVNCDFDNLKFQNDTFDTIVSSFSLQWSLNLVTSLREANRVLKSGGILIFSIPLQGSLQQIKNLGVSSINKFHNASSIIKMLELAHFTNISFEELSIKQKYDSPLNLLSNIKNIGANLAIDNNDNKNNLSSLRKFKEFEDSWNMGYFICKKI